MRKTCAVLADSFGLRLSPGGISHALGRLEPGYEELALQLHESPLVHTGETSWWVAGPAWWLWVFSNATPG